MPGLSKAKELRAERRNSAERMRELMKEPAGEDGHLSAEQETEFDKLHERQNELGTEITDIEEHEQAHADRESALATLEADLEASQKLLAGKQDSAALDADKRKDEGGDGEKQTDVQKRYAQAFNAYLRTEQMGWMDPEDVKVLRTGYQTVDASAMLGVESRVQSIGDNIKGGFFVPEGVMQPFEAAQLQFGSMRNSGAQVLTTSDGRDIPWPTYDDTSNQGRILTENAPVSTTDVTIGNSVLHAYMYSSDFVKVPWALLQDSEFDIAGMIGAITGERNGRITNVHFTTGDGSSKPFGVAQQATTGVTAAATTSITADEYLDLKHSVDPAYRDGAKWMFHDSTLKALKKLKDGNGNYLWMSGLRDGEPNTIDGDPYVINQQVASIASGAIAVLYGGFSHYKIRDVSGSQLLRLDERFADNGQVAFLLFSRHDGVLVNAGTNPIKRLVLA